MFKFCPKQFHDGGPTGEHLGREAHAKVKRLTEKLLDSEACTTYNTQMHGVLHEQVSRTVLTASPAINVRHSTHLARHATRCIIFTLIFTTPNSTLPRNSYSSLLPACVGCTG